MSAGHGEATARDGGDENGGAAATIPPTPDTTGDVKGLHPRHLRQLTGAGIDPAVIAGRGYRSLNRTNTDDTPVSTLKRLGFARGAWDEDRRFPGLLIPLWGPTGTVTSYQYRPDWPRKDDKGKVRKYEMPKGRSAVLDVHPHNRDRIADPTVRLWITEGIKKGDALTSRGECVVTLSGVFNWRSTHGTLGDWEDVPLRGREVLVLFDADAATNRNVARAMARLGRWLRSKQAVVRYIVCPVVNGDTKTGADDFLASGGTVAQLEACARPSPPDPDAGDDSLTDSRLAERFADERLQGQYRYCAPLGGWHRWGGAVWVACPDEEVIEQTRQWLRDMLADALADRADAVRLGALAGLQNRSRIAAVAALCRGMDGILTEPLEFEDDPWLLCAGNGVVDLRTGQLNPHDPDLLMLRRTPVDYIDGATHPDWDRALQAFPDLGTAGWAQVVLGTGATGQAATSDEAHFLIGGGANGKTTVIGACRFALGDYAKVIAASLLGGSTPGHPTIKMELFRLRLAIVEELQEGHLLDEARLKEITGSAEIVAYRMRQDPVTFPPSHTLVVSSNHTPKVRGTDTGIWRRLRLVPFPHTFTGAGADPLLRHRLHTGRDQQRAVLAWLVAGAMAYHRSGQVIPDPPQVVQQATRQWRTDADEVASFIGQHYNLDPEAEVETAALLTEFNDHMVNVERSRPWGRNTFTERLKGSAWLADNGVSVGQHPRTRRSVVRGVRKRNPWSEAHSAEGAKDCEGPVPFLPHEERFSNKQTGPSQSFADPESQPAKPRCRACQTTVFMKPGEDLCANCKRADYLKTNHRKDPA